MVANPVFITFIPFSDKAFSKVDKSFLPESLPSLATHISETPSFKHFTDIAFAILLIIFSFIWSG